ncbi:MAG: DUF5317 domain-containing protein [Tissierellaceae bacterium]|nr:DUF5317 domain-containing protein [Tissierellia bacterium]
MVIEPVLLSIIVGKLRKGKFNNLEKIYLRGWYLLLIAALTQFLSSLMKGYGIRIGGLEFEDYFYYIHIASYLLMLVCIVLNLKKKSMKLFLIGLILNFIVIFANGGKMPVSLTGIKGIKEEVAVELPMSDFDIKHQAVTPDTKFVYLADIILIPEPYPLPKILSLGDIFIMGGLFVFLQEAMLMEKDELGKIKYRFKN